jgi:hypothetical protein
VIFILLSDLETNFQGGVFFVAHTLLALTCLATLFEAVFMSYEANKGPQNVPENFFTLP